jgi:hypothetical protein
MVRRLFVALVGAVVITGGMLLGMSGIVDAFRNRDPTRYFSITNIISRPAQGRRERPGDIVRAPERRTPAYEGEASDIPLETPEEPALETPPEATRPALDAP